ncbi:MAG: hypothetical protein K2X72_04365 [Reyranella sp.]|nr:hypothetical protein [Reyranella sp.]
MSDSGETKRRNYSLFTRAQLFAMSGNHCAFPGCSVRLVQDSAAADGTRIMVAEIAHIIGLNPTAARWQAGHKESFLNSEDNLVLMCPTHHSIIDKDESYTVERVRGMKQSHIDNVESAMVQRARGELTADREYNLLQYKNSTEPTEKSVNEIVGASTPFGIQYSERIVTVLQILEGLDRDPSPYFAKTPAVAKAEQVSRAHANEVKAGFTADISEWWRRARWVIKANEADIVTFRQRLHDDKVNIELAREAMAAFARFAALRLIRALQRFIDIENGQPKLYFEEYVFSKSGGYYYFDLAPKQSDTGYSVFGFRHYVDARVGRYPNDYEYAMLPLELTRPAIADNGRGNAELFYCWVLPQIFLIMRDESRHTLQVDNWRVLLCRGADREREWYHGEDPWPSCIG